MADAAGDDGSGPAEIVEAQLPLYVTERSWNCATAWTERNTASVKPIVPLYSFSNHISKCSGSTFDYLRYLKNYQMAHLAYLNNMHSQSYSI